VKDAFEQLITKVRAGLEQKPTPAAGQGEVATERPLSVAAQRTELTSRFANELERVGGHFMGLLSRAAAREKATEVVRALEARSVAVGEGLTLDPAPIARTLEAAGISLIRCGKSNGGEPAALRARLAACDLAIVEADYAIASTGTLVMVATPGRPGSLTLLPPANLILVDAARVLPTMATVVSALGANTARGHRIVFITGPSRTADIEKMIVLGVHGPKHLYAAVLWQERER